MTGSAQAIPRTSALRPLLDAMRPYQWPKNALVFAALAFSAGDAWRPGDAGTWWPLLWRTVALFVLFCMISSSTYLINDVQDREFDQQHPRKRLRPIASGAVTPGTARLTAFLLAAVALPLAFVLDPGAGAIMAGYAAIMTGYSCGLKRIPILDVLVLCTGVIGRAVAGAAVIDVTISPWLYVCTSFGAFFFASSKRWAEYRHLGPEAAAHRPSLAHYTGDVLDQMVVISAAAALLSYSLYTIESANVPKNGAMAITIPFVAFGVFRFLLLINGKRRTDAPDQIVFTDPQILLAVAGFVATAVAVLLNHQA